MAEDIVTIIKVGTDEAVRSIGDLKNNVSALKSSLNDLEIGTQEYDDTLQELRVNQSALNNAMKGSTQSIDQLAAAARGTAETYNGLVAQMADMRRELRNIDVSTEEGQAHFKALAADINEVNDKLKEMDASTGNYQRNVGNYSSALDGLGGILKSMPATFGSVKEQMGKVGETMQLVGKNPLLGIVGLLAPLLVKIVGALQRNETAMTAVDKAMQAMQPVMDAVGQLIEWIAGLLARAVDWLVSMAEQSSGTFGDIIAGAVGVGNTILQFILAPIKTVIQAFKGLGNIIKDVFTGQFSEVKKHATEAWDGIADAFSKGFDFKDNFAKGKEVGAAFIAGLGSKSNTAAAADAGKETGKAYADAAKDEIATMADDIISEIDGSIDEALKDLDKQQERAQKILQERQKERLALLDEETRKQLFNNNLTAEDAGAKAEQAYQIQADANARKLELLQAFAVQALEAGDLTAYLDYQQQQAALSTKIEEDALTEQARLRATDVKDAEAAAKAKADTWSAYQGAVTGVLSSVADALEAADGESVKTAKAAKALRIATAVIDTLSGAVTAFAQAQQLGPIAGPIVGAINAAAVTAAGVAQIAKIKATKVGDGSDTGGSASVTSASVAAPAVTTQYSQVRSITTASEEDRLNEMAKSQRVYILADDIQASNNARRVQVTESSF